MPKATLSFNLPEEQSEHRDCINANKMYSVLWDLDQDCRGFLKFGTDKFERPGDVLQWVREQIPYELFEE